MTIAGLDDMCITTADLDAGSMTTDLDDRCMTTNVDELYDYRSG